MGLFKNKFNTICSRALKLTSSNSFIYYQSISEEEQNGSTSSLRVNTTQNNKKKNTEKHRICYLSLLPVDILYTIFENLSGADLLGFTNVSDPWHDFLVDWPRFWQKITMYYPDIKQSTLDILIHRRCSSPRQVCLESPVNHSLLCSLILLLIQSPNRHIIKKLSFQNIRIIPRENGGAPHLLGYAISNMNSIEYIEFNNCSFTKHSELKTVLQSCSNITSISFDYPSDKIIPNPNIYPVYLPAKQDLPKAGLPYLTYLKLAAPADFQIDGGRSLPGVFSQCPNLRHLFLDTFMLTHNGSRIIDEVLTFCPYILNFVVSDNAQVPMTFTTAYNNNDNDDDDENGWVTFYDNSSSNKSENTTQGLRRLILCSKKIKLGENAHGDVLFKYIHSSLELLYLHCQLKGSSCHQAYYELTDLAWPKLREINLSLQINSGNHISHERTTMVRLANLFFRCPALQVITIDSFNVTGSHRLRVDDMVLKRIAENCPLIYRLHILGEKFHSEDAILYFAKTLGQHEYNNLTDLEIDMARKPLLEVIGNLKSLKQLYLRNDTVTYIDPTISTFYMQVEIARQLLRERGGSLIIK
ncbi:hypothetical protein BDA99DRAFT_610163 [Phascolomyces articulosus]|uniref:F-box domain-containing protein n=1 Tax=Phascolomyces articulosus TaxID=60185 RepID=A0AAD5JL18_9FUNG|nr:hypothetical protein BDA99DRAFT_610163 [Phascolomyces articulosus]